MAKNPSRIENGKLLRRAVNYAINTNEVRFELFVPIENRWIANIYFFENKYDPPEIFEFEVEFLPGSLDFSMPVFSMPAWDRYVRERVPVDFKTYRWACRKLEEFQIMQKLIDDT